MQLPWLKTKIVIEKVYVPVIGTDTRAYFDKWQDDDYLRQVRGLSGNSIFNSEIIEALVQLRNKADSVETPEELRGINAGISAIKSILTAPERANYSLKQANDRKELEKEQEGIRNESR